MSTFFEIDDNAADISPALYVTCAGTVKAPHGAGIVRLVVAYRDGDPTVVVGFTRSTLPNGDFSMLLPGHDTAEFTVIAKGERGENDTVYGNCNVNGTGPTGLYIAPTLGNIAFIVGPGDVTSPIVDILIPVFEVTGEGEVTIISTGNVITTLPVIESVGITDIIANGNIQLPFFTTESVVDNFYILDADIKIPSLSINAEVTNQIIAQGNVYLTSLNITGNSGDGGYVILPTMTVDGAVDNPIIADGAVSIGLKVQSSGIFGFVSWSTCNIPMLSVTSESTTNDLANGDINISTMQISSTAEQHIIAIGDIFLPPFKTYSQANSTHVFEAVSFPSGCPSS